MAIVNPHRKSSSGVVLADGSLLSEGSGEFGTWSPQDLQEAYGIPTSGGETQTVAVVDAWAYAHAESDLAVYRERYGLSPCTTANGCFRKVNAKGEEANYPKAAETLEEERWNLETALDLDMVSAACPNCHILLVQGSSLVESLAEAEETAVKLGATEISNSYGLPEEGCEEGCTAWLGAYNHPGIPTTVSSGDFGYLNFAIGAETPSFPAASPNVIAIGGTVLSKAETPRKWAEYAWGSSGGGCSLYEAKPAWQTDTGCSKRMGNDVSIVAEGVSVYVTYSAGGGGWYAVGGTSVGAPLIAGIMAHASKAVREQGAEAFYRHRLYDVSGWGNGYCGRTYLCKGVEGYDGPTGWGSPNGAPEAPVGLDAVTAEATNVTSEGATLNGYVDPEGLATTYRFEYGPTTAYGTSVPVPNASAGSGAIWKQVNQSVSGLEGGTYHYRLVASSSAGTVYGEDHVFAAAPWTVESPVTLESVTEEMPPKIACSSASACLAVGGRKEGSTTWAYAERWTGSEWVLQPPLKPAGAISSEFEDVSCASATACTAVGRFSTTSSTSVTLAERWNGSTWSIQSTPNPSGAVVSHLEAVSCFGASECTAVGDSSKETGPFAASATLAERWNGSEWTIQATAEPPGTGHKTFTDVSCGAAGSCVGVGRYRPAGTEPAVLFAERWNGTEWALQSLHLPKDSKETWSYLNGVSCVSSTVCLATGWYTNKSDMDVPVAQRLNGSWSVQKMQATGDLYTYMDDISCTSITRCVAVGHTIGTNDYLDQIPVTEVWNGTSWTLQGYTRVEEPLAEEDARLTGISCWGPASCAAAGSRTGAPSGWGYAGELLIERLGQPSAETNGASGLAEAAATLNGSVNPQGAATTYHFEYGPTTSYGTKAPVPDAAAGSGTGDVAVNTAIGSLEPEATYHYRLVAKNASGTTYGKDQTLTTNPRSGSWAVKTTPNPSGAKSSYTWNASCSSTTACT
jgi:hypothetical protein